MGKKEEKQSIWQYIKPYWYLLIIAPLLMLVEVFADLLQPRLMSSIIDQGVAKGDIPLIIREGLKMIGITIVGASGGIGCFYTSTLAAESFAADLREGLYKRIQAFSFQNMNHFTSGSLITRLTNDITQVKMVVSMLLRMMIRAPFLFLGSLVMIVQISPKLASTFLVTLPVILLVMVTIIKKGFPLFKAVRKKIDRVNTVMQENLAGVRVVKAFVTNHFEENRFNDANIDLMQTTEKVMKLMAITSPAFSIIMYSTIIATLWIGGQEVNVGALEIGQFMAFIQYIQILLMSLMMIAMFMARIVSAIAAKDRLNELLNESIDITDQVAKEASPSIEKGKVVFENVSFKYEAGKGDAVLKNISFIAEPGQTIGIIGGTGSGKSTLMHLIPRLYDVESGNVLIDDVDVRDYALENLRSKVGIALQQVELFSRSVSDNIAYGNPKATQEEIKQAAKDAEAYAFIQEKHNEFDYVLEQGASNLSGGQKQRLSIARALCSQPTILIFDDSTSAVDVATEINIQKALKERASDKTCFVVAQRISSVLYADKILVLDDGKIVGEGTHSELMQSSEIYQEIYESQLGGGKEENHES